MPGTEPAEGVITRAVRLLEAFDSRSTSLTVSDLSRRSGLPLSTTSRMVAELVRHGLLSRSDDGRRIRVGVRLWELGSRAAPTRTLREAALPFMEDLHTVIHHHVQLGVLDGEEVLFGRETLGARSRHQRHRGRRSTPAAHASSSGLVLLAYAAPEIQESLLTGQLRPFTPSTITSTAELRTVLAEIRRSRVRPHPGTHPRRRRGRRRAGS